MKCIYKEKVDVKKVGLLDLAVLNPKECEGVFDKRKYFGFIPMEKLKEIFEVKSESEVKDICNNNKVYCSVCYIWVDKVFSLYCNNCIKYFCRENNLKNCPCYKRVMVLLVNNLLFINLFINLL
jgi:hypothetical protein